MSHRILTSVAALAGLAVPVTAQQIVYDAAALPAQAIWTDGVEIADVDGDGDLDILFANGSSYGAGGAQPQHFFRNNGSGQFTEAHTALNVANFNAKMVIAEDFDNDGDLDLMYAPEGAANPPTQLPRMLINLGGVQGGTEGVFADQSAARIPNLPMASFCVAAGDVDDDGDLDVCFTDGATFGGLARQARLYLNDGNGVFTDATAANMPADLYNAQDVTMFDFDGDFDIDIALSGKGGTGKRSRLYLNDGTGKFSISTILDALGTGNTYEIDWGDLDGDGDFDAAVQSISGVSEGWARNDGTGSAPASFVFPTPNGNDDNEMAMMDYDGDGDLDVFVGNLSAGTERVWRNDGGGVFVNQQGQIQSIADSTLDLGFGDLDGDGDYDMVTGQGESGNFTNRVYKNNGGTDVTQPTLIDQDAPVIWGVPETVFHVRCQDAISDDGQNNMSGTFSYTTNVGSGSGTAVDMGGGLFRAAVPTVPGLNSIDITWNISDTAGNTRVVNDDLAQAGRWTYIDDGTNGVNGMPTLQLTGPQTAGSLTTLSLTNTAPSAFCVFWLAFTEIPTPVWNGTVYSLPFTTQIFVFSNGDGAFNASTNWPAGLPSGINATWQFVCEDNSVVWGGTISNAVRSTTP